MKLGIGIKNLAKNLKIDTCAYFAIATIIIAFPQGYKTFYFGRNLDFPKIIFYQLT